MPYRYTRNEPCDILHARHADQRAIAGGVAAFYQPRARRTPGVAGLPWLNDSRLSARGHAGV